MNRRWDEYESERKGFKEGTLALFLEGHQNTETQEYGRSFQTNRISAEIIGFVITNALSLHSALYSLQTCNLDKQMDGH